jgi:hypothetical protein
MAPEEEMADAIEGVEYVKRALQICDGQLTAWILDGVTINGLDTFRVAVMLGDLPIGELALPAPVLPEGADVGDEMSVDFKIRTCRKCGCTGSRACVMGCEWIEADLCSNCGSVIFDASGRPAV